MFILTISAAILTLINTGIAAFVLLKKRKNQLAKYLGLYILFIAIWVGANAMADVATSDTILRFYSGWAVVGGVFFVSYHLCFVEFFINNRLSKIKKIIFLAPSIIFSIGSFTKLYTVETYFPPNAPTQITLGIISYPILLFLLGGLIYGGARLLYFYPKASWSQKRQIIYIKMGVFLVLFGAIIFTVVLPLLGEVRFYSLGPQFSIFLAIFTSYAILKHKLLDIKIVIQRGLIYTAILSIIITFYLAVLFSLLFLFKSNSHSYYLLSALITTTIGIFTVPTIEIYFRRLTDKIFFKNKYDYCEALRELSVIANKNIGQQDIVDKTTNKLKQIFHINEARYDLSLTSNQTAFDNRQGQVVCLPLKLENRYLGYLFLGHKLSGDQYNKQDLKLLETFTYQAALALEKARLYQEVKDYSKNLEEKVITRTDEIKKLQEKQSQMMLDISHALQTPLTVVKGELSRLENDQVNNNIFKIFTKSIDNISKFITDLLKLAKLDFEFNNPHKQQINLSVLLIDLIEYFTVLAESQKIEIISNITPNIYVLGQANRLEELVTNLISNAFKYTANEKKIAINLTTQQNSVILTIADTGLGIPPENIPNLFNRFYRADNQPDDIKGTGLGLAICEKIVKNHGGSIEIESELNKGTKVNCAFPLCQ